MTLNIAIDFWGVFDTWMGEGIAKDLGNHFSGKVSQ
jgi:hypothetical protein